MKHSVIYRREGWYTAFPRLDFLQDGRLSIGVNSSPFHDHYLIGEWRVLVSEDSGDTWQDSLDPSIPHNWDAPDRREKYDRYMDVLDDGTWLSAGSVGWQEWPSSKRDEIQKSGLMVREHQTSSDKIVSGGNGLFFQRSQDCGKTWDRYDYLVPGVRHIMAFPRSIKLLNGTILIPVGSNTEDHDTQAFVWRSGDHGQTFQLLPMGPNPCTQETAFLEYSPGHILALTRAEPAPGYLLEMRSDDGGRSWSWPMETEIWAPHSPPHLLKLRDGRILCSYGYRENPMGIRAVISHDNGSSWAIDDTYVLREDGGYPAETGMGRDAVDRGGRPMSDVGYPQSVQLLDDSILTAYYITLEDGVSHAACTKWNP